MLRVPIQVDFILCPFCGCWADSLFAMGRVVVGLLSFTCGLCPGCLWAFVYGAFVTGGGSLGRVLLVSAFFSVVRVGG